MTGYQAEKRADRNVLEMTVTGEKDKSHSLSLLISKGQFVGATVCCCLVLQDVSPSAEHLFMAGNLPR